MSDDRPITPPSSSSVSIPCRLRACSRRGQLQSFHDKSVRRMIDFQDVPTDAIHGIEAPTMVMCGDADVVRPEHAVEMFRALPHAQLAILPATNHMTFVKNAEPAAGMITAFLDAPIRASRPALKTP